MPLNEPEPTTSATPGHVASTDQLGALAPLYRPPKIRDAKEMGRTGGTVSDAERMAFEAWMRGHCWQHGDWIAGAYNDMTTRMLWAAWRDRAALAKLDAERLVRAPNV